MATWGTLAHCCGLYRSIGRNRTALNFLLAPRRSVGVRDTRIAGVHQFPSPEIKNEKAARTFIVTLDDRSRRLLLQEMQNFESEKSQTQSGHHFDAWKWSHDHLDPATPYAPNEPTPTHDQEKKATMTRAELWNVFLFHGIPFVGFGILDNLIMIVAGEYIDATLGAVLGISTMAAAGLGNLVSDVAGVGTAGYVEAWTSKIGVTVPVLSAEQASQRSTRISIGLGRALGISVGCLIGMFPLLFFDGRPDPEECSTSTTEGATSKTNPEPASPKPST